MINTADVDRINSCGVRDWVNWLSELEKKEARFFFVECSPAIMAQVNLVNNFVGSGRILNFYAPYFCSSCDTDKMLLIETKDTLRETPFTAPTCRCDQCDHTMEFDDIESSYFAFLGAMKQEELDPAVKELVRKTATDSGEGRLRARVSQQIPTLTPSTPTSPSLATTPDSRDLKGLLTDSINLEQARFTKKAEQPTGTRTILYLVIGLLTLAIGLLGYVVIRST